MNGVIGMTTLLLDTTLSEDQRDFVETNPQQRRGAARHHQRRPRLLQDRVGPHGAGEPALQRPLLHRGGARSPRPQRGRRRSSISPASSRTPFPPYLSGDVTRLRQILVNLTSNAIKFTTRGEVVLNVVQENTGSPGAPVLHFAIRDTGIGIPREKQDSLFKMFTQVGQLDRAALRRHRPGPRHLQAAGRADGRPDLGGKRGRDRLHLPLHHPPDRAGNGRDGDSDRPLKLSAKKILIVEDNTTNGQILAHFTESLGLRPEVVGDSAQALARLQSGAVYALVILDQQLPDMDGLKLAEEIRLLPRGAAVPIILLSSTRLPSPDPRSPPPGFPASCTSRSGTPRSWRP